jgi:hypothetical protein
VSRVRGKGRVTGLDKGKEAGSALRQDLKVVRLEHATRPYSQYSSLLERERIVFYQACLCRCDWLHACQLVFHKLKKLSFRFYSIAAVTMRKNTRRRRPSERATRVDA